MKITKYQEKSTVKPVNAVLLESNGVYELVITMSSRYFDYRIDTKNHEVFLTVNDSDSKKLSVYCIEVDEWKNLSEDEYDFIFNVADEVDKEEICVILYPFNTEETAYVSKIEF